MSTRLYWDDARHLLISLLNQNDYILCLVLNSGTDVLYLFHNILTMIIREVRPEEKDAIIG